mgnify:CR=1 FL=1
MRENISYNTIDLEPDIAVGIALPFSSKFGGLFHLNYSTEDQAISNLKNLLLTKKGERIMLPTFGSSLYSLLFDQNVDDLPVRIKNELKLDISLWCPQIIVTSIDVKNARISGNKSDGHGIQIILNFKVDISQSNKTIVLFINNNGIAQIVNDQSTIISLPDND